MFKLLISMAQLYIKHKKYLKALEYLNKVLEIIPNNDFALSLRGEAYRCLNEYDPSMNDLALHDFSMALDINPRNVLSLVGRSCIYIETKKYTEAIADIRTLIEIDSKYSPIWARLGEIYLLQRNYCKALKAFSCALKLNKNDSRALAGRGFLKYLCEENEDALSLADQSLQNDSNNVLAIALKGEILRLKNDSLKAKGHFEMAVKIRPDYKFPKKRLEQLNSQPLSPNR